MNLDLLDSAMAAEKEDYSIWHIENSRYSSPKRDNRMKTPVALEKVKQSWLPVSTVDC